MKLEILLEKLIEKMESTAGDKSLSFNGNRIIEWIKEIYKEEK